MTIIPFRAHTDWGGPIPADAQWVDGHPFPPGVEAREVPRPRSKWRDVIVCDQCGRAWLIMRRNSFESRLVGALLERPETAP